MIIECSLDHSGGNIASPELDLATGAVASTFDTCLSRCSRTKACKAVSWLSGPKNCYLKGTIGTGKTNTGVWGARVNGTRNDAVVSSSSSSSSKAPSATPVVKLRRRAAFGGIDWTG
ncbi:hypothetical protein LTS18_011297 [Coniosporium uncinatum]|uniref:Uncharacterized protein n=1 Tax=Coniosporium uncinatum TaxID=93489 RepID=A0ACC3DKH6_9PEZI|nr:hypothetical protein LTS18_011297 [Coniosporium uncinatum]